MRRFWLAAALVLGGCGGSLGREYEAATNAIHGEHFDEAKEIADRNRDRAEAGDDLSKWRFRLLYPEILLGREKAGDALKLLDKYGEPLGGPGADLLALRAKAHLLRGQALYAISPPRYVEADELLKRAADESKAAHSEPLSALIELRQGTSFLRQKRLEEARAAFQISLDAATKLKDSYLAARASGNIGAWLLRRARYDEAIPLFEEARGYSNGAADSVARAEGNLGICYSGLGDYASATRHFDLALSGFTRTRNLYEQQVFLGDAANLLFFQEKYGDAMVQYRKAAAIASEIKDYHWAAIWLGNLAFASIKLADWNGAKEYLEQARAAASLDKSPAESARDPLLMLISAQIAEGTGHFAESADLFRMVLESESDEPSVPLDAHAGLARLHIRNHQYPKAESEFLAAIHTIDERGATLLTVDYKLAYLASLIDFERTYVDFLMNDLKDHERALAAAEASRSRVLAGRTGSPTVKQGGTRDYRKLATQTGAILLEYWMSKSQGYLWVVTPDGVFWQSFSPREILPLVERWRGSIEKHQNPLEAEKSTGHELYNTLLSVAVRQAHGRSRFVIVPDEGLDSLNFESLPGADASKFWIEDATVEIAPSLNYLVPVATGSGHVGTNRKTLLMGDPNTEDPDYPKLEHASQELDSIAKAMPRPEPSVIKGSAATPVSYKNASPDQFGVIHFAAHASASGLSPLDSAIILSGPRDKCSLRARDVMAIPLTADLVTVSACQSAGSKAYAGEGMVGFAWAFLKAGAGNVIATLWDVNDRSTERLMSNMYSEIAGGAPIAEALRRSKRKLIDNGGVYAKPYYWAPFQLYTARGN